MLDFVEITLYQMTLLVKMLVIFSALFAVFAVRNDSFCTFSTNRLDKLFRIIGAVRNYSFKLKISNQCFCLCNIMPLATSQKITQWIAKGINTYVDFCAKPAPAAPKGLFCLPTVFFRAPAAHGCALTTLLSRMRFSISGSSAKC